MAKIVLQEEQGAPDLNDLRRYCYQHLARYKVPKDFEFVDQLPEDRKREIEKVKQLSVKDIIPQMRRVAENNKGIMLS